MALSFLFPGPCSVELRPFDARAPRTESMRNWLPRQAPPLHLRINSAAFCWFNYRGIKWSGGRVKRSGTALQQERAKGPSAASQSHPLPRLHGPVLR